MMDEGEEFASECGQEAFEAADIMGTILDRWTTEWGQEDPNDVMRARDLIRATLVSVVALVGGGSPTSTIANRLARGLQRAPEINALRDALRRGEQVPQRDLLAIYNRVTREVEQ